MRWWWAAPYGKRHNVIVAKYKKHASSAAMLRLVLRISLMSKINSARGPIPEAPSELIAGLGAFDQKLYLIPSKNLVIVRLGDDAGESQLGPSSFDNQLWEKLNAYID